MVVSSARVLLHVGLAAQERLVAKRAAHGVEVGVALHALAAALVELHRALEVVEHRAAVRVELAHLALLAQQPERGGEVVVR